MNNSSETTNSSKNLVGESSSQSQIRCPLASENGQTSRLRSPDHQDLSRSCHSDLDGPDHPDRREHGLSKRDEPSGSKAKKTGLTSIIHRVSKKFSKGSKGSSQNLSLKNSANELNVYDPDPTEDGDIHSGLMRLSSMAMSVSFHEALETNNDEDENPPTNMRKKCERLFRSRSVEPKQAVIEESIDEKTLKPKQKSKPRLSTARKFAFNPCFSPTVSDDEWSVHEEEEQPTSSRAEFVNPMRRNETPTSDRAMSRVETAENLNMSTSTTSSNSHSVLPRPLANAAGSAMRVARDLRARLAFAAASENQQLGPGHMRHVSSAMPNCVPGIPQEGRKHVHTIVEYTNVLVPAMITILNSPYYWGTMDRYEAEKLLEGKPEGTFLLRDSAQLNYVFSVSFRRYQRTLHARIEQSHGKFSFDIHDSTVFSANKITDLIENYKDPSRCLFFEPQLSVPLCRNYVFSLKELSRAVVAGSCTYDSVQDLPVPPFIKKQVREYHYKQAVRVTDKENSAS